MSDFVRLVHQRTARQHGAVARWQTDADGVPGWAVDHLVRRGVLIVEHAGVYRHAAVPYTRELRWLAAVLAAGPGAALSHRAAGALHTYGLRRVRPELTAPYSRLPLIPGVDVHRSRRLTPRDVTVVGGIPVTTRPRTMLDLAAVLPYGRLSAVAQDAVARNLVKVEALLAVVDRRGGRGVPGTVALRHALADGLVDDKLESRLELLIARIIAGAEIPPPVRQHELRCADGRVVRLDNAWPELKVAVEGDGRRWHGSAHQARRTRDRSRSIVRSGYSHYVYGWSEATEAAAETRQELEAVFRDLLRRGAA